MIYNCIQSNEIPSIPRMVTKYVTTNYTCLAEIEEFANLLVIRIRKDPQQ